MQTEAAMSWKGKCGGRGGQRRTNSLSAGERLASSDARSSLACQRDVSAERGGNVAASIDACGARDAADDASQRSLLRSVSKRNSGTVSAACGGSMLRRVFQRATGSAANSAATSAIAPIA